MSTMFVDFSFNRTVMEMKVKGIVKRYFVENYTTNVVVSINFCQFILLTSFRPFHIDVGVIWNYESFYFVELWRTCVLYVGRIWSNVVYFLFLSDVKYFWRFTFPCTASEKKEKKIEKRCLVPNFMANVVVSFNFNNIHFWFHSACFNLILEYFEVVEVLF